VRSLSASLHRRLFLGFLALCSGAVGLCLGVSVALGGGNLRDVRTLVQVLVALVAVLACSGVAMSLIRRALEPLRALREAVREAANSRYRSAVTASGAAEVEALAEDIERLRQEHCATVRAAEGETQRLLELSKLPATIDARRGEIVAARTALESVLGAVGSPAGAVYLLEEGQSTLRLIADSGLRLAPSAEVRTVPATHGFMGRALNYGQAMVLDEEGAWSWVSEVWDTESAPAGVACVPLRSADKPVGVLNAILRSGDPLSPDVVEMLETIAAQIGAALDSAQVFAAARRREQHITALLETSAEVARGRRTRQVLDLVLAKVRERTGVEKCAIFLVNEDVDQCRVAAHAGLSDRFLERLRELAPNGPTGRAMRERRSVSVSSASVDPSVAELYVVYREERIESVLVAPLLGADRTYGTIELYRDAKGPFSPEEGQLLSILSNQAAIALTNAELHEESLRRLSALETIVETTALFGASSDPNQIVQTAVRKARELFHCEACYVCLRSPETGRLELQGAVGVAEAAVASLREGLDPARCWAVQKGSPFMVRDTQWDLTCEQEHCGTTGGSHVCAPLTAGGECFGVMHMRGSQPRAFSADEERLFCTIAEQVAIAAQRAQLFQQVQESATTDPMTGAHNYRRFRQQLLRELDEARRYERPLSLILLDLDHFKEHNDTFGHPSGDEVLRKLAKVLSSCLRAVDFFARYGGEEFVVVLPETSKEGAQAVAEKIRSEVEAATFYGDASTPEVTQTLSLGVASFPADGDADERLIAAADRALYRAKENGRNRVEVASAS